MSRAVWAALAFLIALAGPAALSPAPAQAPTAAPPASEPRVPPPASIPVPEVARQAEETGRLLREFETLLAPSPAREAAEKRLPGITASIVAQSEETRQAAAGDPSPATIDRLTIRWQTTREELVGYINRLARQATAAEGALEQLTRLRETWTRARADAQASRAPQQVIARIDGVLDAITASRTRLLGHRGGILVLQDRVARELAQCDAMLTLLAAGRSGTATGLFHRDAVPLWHPGQLGAMLAAGLRELPYNAAEADGAQLRQFAEDQWGRILLHAVLFLGLLALTQAARRRSHLWTTPAGTPDRLVIAERPVSVALVLALLMSLWIYTPPIPRAATAVITVLILLPALRIARLTLPSQIAPHIYVLGLLFLADLLRNLASIVPVLEREIFLLEMSAAVGLLAWRAANRRRGAPAPDTPPARMLRVAGMLALPIFAVALIAGVAGYMRLGLFLGAGLLGGGYLAVVLHAGVQGANGLVALALHERPLSALAMVRHNRPLLERRTRRLVRAVAAIAWVYFALKYFYLWNDAVTATEAALSATLSRGSLSISLADVLVFVVTVGAAFVLSRVIRFVLAEEVYPRLQLGRGLPDALSGVLHYSLLLFGFLLALAALGVDLTKVTILAGAFGVGIGFGLQNIVNNLVSGSIILMERKINVGDAVQIGEVAGRVQQMGMRACTVRTWEGAEVIVPNASLTSGNVVNWTLSDPQRRIDLAVGVAYGTPPEKVLDVLLGVASAHPRVMPVPAPAALFRTFGDSALRFELRVWTDRFDLAPQTQSELSVALYAALREAGIEIPFPQQEVHLRQKPT